MEDLRLRLRGQWDLAVLLPIDIATDALLELPVSSFSCATHKSVAEHARCIVQWRSFHAVCHDMLASRVYSVSQQALMPD